MSGIIDLNGKKGLVVGIANDQSIAYGCAKIFRDSGADLAITYLNYKAKPHVEPLAQELGADIFMPLNVQHDDELDALFNRIADTWGRLDFLMHAIAFAPKDDLHARVTDCSKNGFLTAMDISCHSLMRMTKKAEPLMTSGGSVMTLSYYGSEKVVPHYNMMGPVKAALESSVRYLAAELGEVGIRVNALSPGPIATRAASGIKDFDELISAFQQKAPLHHEVSLQDVGYMAAFLASDAAKSISGTVQYIDSGYQIID
jgi:enoyl-[acyl-carrier protein] reductase I